MIHNLTAQTPHVAGSLAPTELSDLSSASQKPQPLAYRKEQEQEENRRRYENIQSYHQIRKFPLKKKKKSIVSFTTGVMFSKQKP